MQLDLRLAVHLHFGHEFDYTRVVVSICVRRQDGFGVPLLFVVFLFLAGFKFRPGALLSLLLEAFVDLDGSFLDEFVDLLLLEIALDWDQIFADELGCSLQELVALLLRSHFEVLAVLAMQVSEP